MKKLVVIGLLALYALPAWADIHSDMNRYFHHLSINGKIVAPPVHKVKPVRYYEDGGFHAPSDLNNKIIIDVKSIGHPCGMWTY